MKRISKCPAAALLTLLACAAFAGCGDGLPERVPVAGVVLVDGMPLSIGMVTVAPDSERPSIGAVDKDGHFKLTCYTPQDGVVPGTHRVAINAAEPLSEKSIRWHAPKKYKELDTSDLKVTIDGPMEDLKIELTWGGGKPFVENF